MVSTDVSNDDYYYYKVTIELPFSDAAVASGTNIKLYPASTFTDTTHPYLFIPAGVSIPNYYNKYIMWNQSNNTYINIVSYDMDTHLALLGDITSFSPEWTVNDNYVIRLIPPVQQGVTTGNSSGQNVFVGTAFFTQPASFYINSFIRFISSDANNNLVSKIVNVSPLPALITPQTSMPPPTAPPPNTLVISPPLNAAITSTPANFEILQFSRDNYSPFVYTGTLTGTSQSVAQEITLNSLTLPNVYLRSGGRIAYYPYVYVVLENVSTTGGNAKNLIYSNNPHTYKAVFRVPITDLNHPSTSPFVKLTANGMKQTISIKQNDDTHISILMPNGDLFQPISSDNPQGQAPNQSLQASILFACERV